jgi:hypothetical protein
MKKLKMEHDIIHFPKVEHIYMIVNAMVWLNYMANEN